VSYVQGYIPVGTDGTIVVMLVKVPPATTKCCEPEKMEPPYLGRVSLMTDDAHARVRRTHEADPESSVVQ
jgi:hypothetical protein